MNFEKDNAKKIYCEELAKYEEYKKLGLNLNMSRGKPSKEQLDLSNAFFDVLTSKSDFRGSQDYRSYGLVDGIPEAKKLFADLSGVSDKEVIVMGNSSLNIMYDSVQRAMQFGVSGGVPFNKQGGIKWLCPVPGVRQTFCRNGAFRRGND
jgi:hypothetical protein